MLTKSQNQLYLNILIFFFMLFAVDFLGYGWYIFGGVFALAILFLIKTNKRININTLLGWVILLAVSNFTILNYHLSSNIIVKVLKYLISPIGGCLIGILLARERKEASILKLYMYAVVPYLIHGILNLVIFKGFSGFERELADFWTGKMWKATLACTYFAMPAPLLFIAFLTKNKTKRLFYILSSALAVYACMITSSRSVLLIAGIVIVFEFFLYVKAGKMTSKKIKVLFAFLFVLAIVGIVIYSNMDSLSTTEFGQRMNRTDVKEEPRIQLFMNIIDNFWMYPFGNMPYFYSHNTWLDFLRESGWIPFICFMAITIVVIYHLIRIFKNKSISLEHRIAVVGMMTALLIDMFVEPMMDGAAILFCLFFYFAGINSQFIKAPKAEEDECQN